MSAHVEGDLHAFLTLIKNDGEKHLGRALGFLHSVSPAETSPSDLPP